LIQQKIEETEENHSSALRNKHLEMEKYAERAKRHSEDI